MPTGLILDQVMRKGVEYGMDTPHMWRGASSELAVLCGLNLWGLKVD